MGSQKQLQKTHTFVYRSSEISGMNSQENPSEENRDTAENVHCS